MLENIWEFMKFLIFVFLFFFVQKLQMCGCSVFTFDKIVLDNKVFRLGMQLT